MTCSISRSTAADSPANVFPRLSNIPSALCQYPVAHSISLILCNPILGPASLPQNKILPPDTKLQPLLHGERKYVEKDTKVSEYGASAVGNRVLDPKPPHHTPHPRT
jgi:hypothetical protein